MPGQTQLLKMRKVSKSFPGVRALDEVDFDLNAGEVHVLLGENGAGKSTLMKILSGSYACDAGEILVDGAPTQFHSPIAALRGGVAMIYQELNPVPHMTIAENVFLGKEPRLTRIGLVDKKKMHADTAVLLGEFGMDFLNPRTKMVELSVAETQMIEIIKAYSFHTKILIMDEPTSALADHEVEKLFQIMGMLKNKNVGIVYISHKMNEIFRCGDRLTVLRDGRYVGTRSIGEIDREEAIRMMIGRDLVNQFPKEEVPIGEVILEAENLCDAEGRFSDISFQLRRGEILGVAGLMGAGRSEVVEAIFGIRRIKSGKLRINGKEVSARTPSKAMRAGLALVTEDRKGTGLNLKSTVRENISICTLDKISKVGILSFKKENHKVDGQIKALGIRTPSRNQMVNFLSGGNQQKVVVSKWLLAQPEIFIMDEPTRGIDVGAKSEIYQIVNELARQGKGIIMVSSELPEILGMCDRVLVMHEGTITGNVLREAFDQERIMRHATGVREGVAQ